MFKIKENDLFKKNMSGSELYKTTKMGKDNSKKLVTDYDKESFDKWMKDLINQNGVTKYQYGEKVRKQVGRNNNGDSNHNNNDSKMSKRNFKITKKKGEWYNTEVTDSYGNEYQNWYETAEEASVWIHYVWEKEDWFNSVDSQELLYKAIQECKAIDKEKGIGSIL